MSAPFLSAVCLTYGRTKFLSEAVACFLEQSYSGPKELVVYNTFPKQTLVINAPDVRVINCKSRPPSLGDARNDAIDRCAGDWCVTWDDDDLYLPNHLSNFADHIEGNHWLWMTRQFFAMDWRIQRITGGSQNVVAFSKHAWRALGGYASVNCGEDRQFVGRLTSNFPGRNIELPAEKISFIYCWANGAYHISGFGDDNKLIANGWQRAERALMDRVKRNQEPIGQVVITPALRHSYATMALEYVTKGVTNTPTEPLCIVELGRLGDIINILPVAQYIHNHYGKPHFMVSREFADLLDGVSYVIPHVVDLVQHELPAAMVLARKTYKRVIQAQIWGHGWVQHKECESYNKESWRVAGFLHLFEDRQYQPVFDRRDPEREALLWNKINDGRPVILINTTRAISSPFAQGKEVAAAIRAEFEPKYNVFDLADLTVRPFYDLLGIIEKAAALVCIDTGVMHLAGATHVPLVALTNPAPWLGTIPRGNQVVERLPYDQASPASVLAALHKVLPLHGVFFDFVPRFQPGAAPQRLLFHAVERHEDRPVERMRKTRARATWDAIYEQGVRPCHFWKYERDATGIGDKRVLPYFKDVLRFAMDQAADDDIVFWTNDDNMLHRDLPEYLRYHVSVYGFCCSQRCEFRNRSSLPKSNATPTDWANSGLHHMGRDLFAATKRWWVFNWEKIPDFICGASDFDLALACLMRHQRGIQSTRKNIEESIFPVEIQRGYVGHESHSPHWARSDNANVAPSQKHNRKLFKEWAATHLPSLVFHENNVI